jgi:hypothetical protein
MEFKIEPYIGAAPITFGMTSDEVRSKVEVDVKQFKKTPISQMFTDAFDTLGVHVYYRKPGICEAIEFGNIAVPTFNDKKLIDIPFIEIKRMFEDIDNSLQINETGLISYKYGIGIFVPTLKKSIKELVKGVIIFEKGYYD